MADEHKLVREVSEGHQAREILDNPAFGRAYEALRANIFAAWEAAPARDAEGREHLWNQLKCLEALKAQLTMAFDKGRFATNTLQQVEEARNGSTGGSV